MSRSKLELLQFIEAQRADYRRTLPEKMSQIETLWQGARQAGEAPDKLSTLERLAHSLHGTAGTYGFRDLSHAGHTLELAVRALMDTGATPTETQQLHITEAINAVRLSLPAQ
jgi:HPt (histidine-containing phosphotransfer) domain-containing protein